MICVLFVAANFAFVTANFINDAAKIKFDARSFAFVETNF